MSPSKSIVLAALLGLFVFMHSSATATSRTKSVGLLQNLAYPTLCLRTKGVTVGSRLDLAPCDQLEVDQLWDVQDLAGYEGGPIGEGANGPIVATVSNNCISVDGWNSTNGATLAMFPYLA